MSFGNFNVEENGICFDSLPFAVRDIIKDFQCLQNPCSCVCVQNEVAMHLHTCKVNYSIMAVANKSVKGEHHDLNEQNWHGAGSTSVHYTHSRHCCAMGLLFSGIKKISDGVKLSLPAPDSFICLCVITYIARWNEGEFNWSVVWNADWLTSR